jgi:hypothetical protein
MRRIVALALLVLAPAIGRAEEKKVTMFAWLGAEAAGRLGTSDFDAFFRRAAKVDDMTIELRPGKARILAEIFAVDIVYANTHSGYPKSAPPRMVLQTGPGTTEDDQLSAIEIAQAAKGAMRLPALVIIDGCNTLAPPPVGGRLLKIHEALQIKPDSKGRAYLGFAKAIVGVRGDEYFRIFFAKWTHAPYPTLTEARQQAIDFLRAPPAGQKYLDKRAAEIGEAVEIVGDGNLTWSQLSGAR